MLGGSARPAVGAVAARTKAIAIRVMRSLPATGCPPVVCWKTDTPRAVCGEATRADPVGCPIIRSLVERNGPDEACISTLLQRIPIHVPHCSDADENRVENRPDQTAATGEKFQQPESGLAKIKPVDAEDAEKVGAQKRRAL